MARDCTAETCPTPGGFVSWPPSTAGNAFMLAAFASLIPVNVYTGIRYKTLLYASLIIAGLLLEIVGHVGKILLQNDAASVPSFALYITGMLWGPSFISAAIFFFLPHVLVIYGQEFRLISRPVYLGVFFIILDVFTLAFQLVGAVYGASAGTVVEMGQGSYILLAGLGLNVAGLATFLVGYRYFVYRLDRRRYVFNPTFSAVFLSLRFNRLLLCMQLATLLLLVRGAVRIAAFSGGLGSVLAQSQVAIFLLDDTLVLIAAIILSAAPPGRAFGPAWAETSPYPACATRRKPTSNPQIKRVISQPYPFTPGSLPPPPPLPQPLPQPLAHRSPHGIAEAPGALLASPLQYPVHHWITYNLPKPQTVPYLSPTGSAPYLSPAGRGPISPSARAPYSPALSSSTSSSRGKKNRARQISNPRLVDSNSIWT
ncbi:RTA1 like protein-domain-containing protein [Lasiosphaeria miniovina]|uniref:RTA1 like protein-domain-containing protein n=1 Tax=Lasiosphaeria miniovina TaxID=1954250 RepID=A0AA40BFI3_9PEZI|nr:RTA1 like protein-domain-containing protein [Lasiosphaeria miniovina]KAK0733307.1 RTA1 like protein-domain-containing protein [Lasiosphaeria miniovina]